MNIYIAPAVMLALSLLFFVLCLVTYRRVSKTHKEMLAEREGATKLLNGAADKLEEAHRLDRNTDERIKQYQGVVETIIGERDRWHDLYVTMSIKHANAQHLLFGALEVAHNALGVKTPPEHLEAVEKFAQEGIFHRAQKRLVVNVAAGTVTDPNKPVEEKKA